MSKPIPTDRTGPEPDPPKKKAPPPIHPGFKDVTKSGDMGISWTFGEPKDDDELDPEGGVDEAVKA